MMMPMMMLMMLVEGIETVVEPEVYLFVVHALGGWCMHGSWMMMMIGGAVCWLGLATGRSRPGSNPTAENFASELWQFRVHTPLCQCLSEETLKAVGP